MHDEEQVGELKWFGSGGGGVSAAIAAGQRIGALEAAKPIEINGTPFLVMAGEQKLEDMSHTLDRPQKLEHSGTLTEAESFIEYVNTFKDDGSRLYGKMGNASSEIVAVLDDHEGTDTPRHRNHRMQLALEASVEWTRWLRNDNKLMTQRQFAEFIEENIRFVANVDASELLAAVKAFSIRKNTVVDSTIDGGNVNCTIHQDVQGTTSKESVSLPRELVIGLRPFKRSKSYEIRAILRFQHVDDGFGFAYRLIEPEAVLESAFNDVRDEVQKGTGLSVLV